MAGQIARRMVPVVVEPTQKHTASLIFLHGSGSNGRDLKLWGEACLNKELSFPHIRLIYPNATVRPYTPANGMMSQVWFDRRQISPFCEEHEESVNESCDYVDSLIEEEVKRGVQRNRIVLGGFSMGGSLALCYGYTRGQELAGICALSSFLQENSSVYQSLEAKPGPHPPLFQCHGGRDNLVLFDWGKSTHERLKQLGIQAQFHAFPNIYHELSRAVMQKLISWLSEVLPE